LDAAGKGKHFSSQLESLEKKASETAASVKAAVEDRAQLKQRIDHANLQIQVNLALKDAQDKDRGCRRPGREQVGQLKADAAAKVDDMKARAAKQADQLDADAAEVEAEWAEVDALDAISYASWTVGRGLPRATRSTPGTRPTNWPPAPPHNGWTPRHGVSRLC
jgi:hypothetical protein